MGDLLPGYVRPRAVPDGWDLVQLAAVASVVQGGRLGLTKSDYRSSGVVAFSAAGPDGFVERAEYDQPAVVLSSIGANCGKCFRAGGQWTTLANTQAILADTRRVDHRYLLSRINDEQFWLRSGSAQPFIKPSSVKQSWIALPPLEEQRRIAEILDTIDDTIQATERVIAKQSAVLAGLSGALFAHGYRHRPLAELSRRITYGFTNPMPTVPTGPLMLTAADVGYRKILHNQARRTSYTAFRELLSDKSRPSAGDILVTKDGTLGRVAVLGPERACVNQSVAVISPVDPTESDFIAEYLLSPAGQQALLAGAGGSTIKHLYISTMADLQIPWPDAGVRSRVVGTLRSALDRVDGLGAEVEKLHQVRTGLASDLLSGHVRTVAA